MAWRDRVADEAFTVLRESLGIPDDAELRAVALEIADCLPSPDERNGYIVVEAAELARLRADNSQLEEMCRGISELVDSNDRLRTEMERLRVENKQLSEFRDRFNEAYDDSYKLADRIVAHHTLTPAIYGLQPDHRFRENARPIDVAADLAAALAARAALAPAGKGVDNG